MVSPIQKATDEANANLLKETILENLALEKAAEPVEIEVMPTEGSPRQIKAIVDSLDWKKIKTALPAADDIEFALKSTISDLLLDKEVPALEKLKVLNQTFKNLGDMYRALVAAKAKQLEKAPQVNVQTNVSTGRHVFNRPTVPSRVLSGPKALATLPPASSQEAASMSHSDSVAAESDEAS